MKQIKQVNVKKEVNDNKQTQSNWFILRKLICW